MNEKSVKSSNHMNNYYIIYETTQEIKFGLICKFCQLLTTHLPLITLVDIWTTTYLPVNIDMS